MDARVAQRRRFADNPDGPILQRPTAAGVKSTRRHTALPEDLSNILHGSALRLMPSLA
jgi:hypothetical protein